MNSKMVRNSKQSKLMRYMKGPIQVLTGAGNLCVRSITAVGGGGGGNMISYGNAMGCPTPRTPTATFEARRRPARHAAASTRGKVEVELRCRSTGSFPSGGVAAVPRRSCTVAFGRIDEEKPFDCFGEEDCKVGLLGDSYSYPKSRSYASISRKNENSFSLT
ncbi:hypothetical protein ACP275_08G060100 [Erythranthe tilingii]